MISLLMSGATARAERPFITTWMHRIDWPLALVSLYENGDVVGEASPAWYTLGENGEALPREGFQVNDSQLISITLEKRMLLRPLLGNFSTQGLGSVILRRVLTEPAIRAAHVQAVRDLVVGNNYDGIDIDYEGLSANELHLLATLAEELAPELHAANKTLAVTLQPLLSEAVIEPWRRIGRVADEVRLMLYDEHAATPLGRPGPTASIDWMANRLAQTKRTFPAEKLTVGLALYANLWQPGGNRSGTWKSMVEPLLADPDYLWRDPGSGSVKYEKEGKVVWFEDWHSVRTKMDVAWIFGVRKFSFWRLGGEDPELWNMLRSWQPLSVR